MAVCFASTCVSLQLECSLVRDLCRSSSSSFFFFPSTDSLFACRSFSRTSSASGSGSMFSPARVLFCHRVLCLTEADACDCQPVLCNNCDDSFEARDRRLHLFSSLPPAVEVCFFFSSILLSHASNIFSFDSRVELEIVDHLSAGGIF